MRDKFPIDIVLAMYTWNSNNNNFLEFKCGFLRDEAGKLHLPSHGLTDKMYASEVIVDIIKKLIRKKITEIDIVPIDFLDPINRDETNTEKELPNERVISLAYKIVLPPATPIYTNIEFLNYKELKKDVIAKRRDTIIFRRGLNS